MASDVTAVLFPSKIDLCAHVAVKFVELQYAGEIEGCDKDWQVSK